MREKNAVVSAGCGGPTPKAASKGMNGPLTDEAEAAIQERVDEMFDMFTKDLARHRGTSQANVKKNFGEGRSVFAKKALAAGMIDGIETFDQTIARVAAGKKLKVRLSAESDSLELDDGDMERRSRRLRSVVNPC